jgi:hypothetical protein
MRACQAALSFHIVSGWCVRPFPPSFYIFWDHLNWSVLMIKLRACLTQYTPTWPIFSISFCYLGIWSWLSSSPWIISHIDLIARQPGPTYTIMCLPISSLCRCVFRRLNWPFTTSYPIHVARVPRQAIHGPRPRILQPSGWDREICDRIFCHFIHSLYWLRNIFPPLLPFLAYHPREQEHSEHSGIFLLHYYVTATIYQIKWAIITTTTKHDQPTLQLNKQQCINILQSTLIGWNTSTDAIL